MEPKEARRKSNIQGQRGREEESVLRERESWLPHHVLVQDLWALGSGTGLGCWEEGWVQKSERKVRRIRGWEKVKTFIHKQAQVVQWVETSLLHNARWREEKRQGRKQEMKKKKKKKMGWTVENRAQTLSRGQRGGDLISAYSTRGKIVGVKEQKQGEQRATMKNKWREGEQRECRRRSS